MELVSVTAPARAAVTVHTDKSAVDRLAAQAGVQLPDIDQQLQTELERLFQTYRLKDYLRAFNDMKLKPQMDEAWMVWVDRNNPPARATVEVQLGSPDTLVEIMCVAAKT